MAAYRRVYDSHHLQADCQEPGSAPEPCARQSSMGYLYLTFTRSSADRAASDYPVRICDRWLDSGRDDGMIERQLAPVELIPDEEPSPPSQTQPADGTHTRVL